MKRLKSFFNFLANLFGYLAVFFFILAVVLRNENIAILGLILIGICGIISFKTTKAKEEEEANKEEK